MPTFQNLECWLQDCNGNVLHEEDSSEAKGVITVNIVTKENLPFVVFWKNTASDVSPLDGRWQLQFRPDAGQKSHCLSGKWMDAQRGNSRGMLYRGSPLATPRAYRNTLMCTVTSVFYILSSSSVPEHHVTFKFMLRKAPISPPRKRCDTEGTPRTKGRSQTSNHSSTPSSSKRKRTEFEGSSCSTERSRLRPRTRQCTSESPRPSMCLDDLLDDSRKLKNERTSITQEESQACALLEKQNAELREQNKLRRMKLDAAKKEIILTIS
ncbi:hypothetical protein QCA50_000360 [Cerrena zonata]|uniref:Uncharacterized protein n=1 Tax=Cerrena zonata TaxID=2478898 RepID=A0AAW0GZX1_9APHY